ncbi:non-ribosomal peptide synthase/polyketide synthase [Marinobacter salarius]|uniref:non-ribosomal peptide synthase/polyketide synthase n=1 Tax=Marinobacter salarius TaxID=1420917 RepID=UPI003BA880A3
MQDNAMALSRRFLGLSADKRQVFLRRLQEQGLDLSSLPIPSGMAGDASPASFAQQRLWFIDQLEPGNSAYHLPGAIRLNGPLDVGAVQAAFDTLALRHHSLRTTFRADENGEPLQVVGPVAQVDVPQLSADSEVEFQTLVREIARQPFDLAAGPLWRVALVRMAEHDHRLVLCLHHIIADGWSIQVLLTEFAQCYRAALAGEVADLPSLPLQYADVALWQRRGLEAGAGEADLDYWTRQLGDEPPVLELPTDRPRPAQQSFRGGRYHFTFDDTVANALNALARSRGTTFFTVMLAAYKVLLYRLSGQTDLSVGVPIAGREQAELEGLIGFFVNTQVLRSDVAGGDGFTAILSREHEIARQAQTHQALPFEHLVDQLQPERSLSHNPLFQVLYNHQQRDGERFELTPGVTAELLAQDAGAAQFDLALHTWAFPDGRVGGNWNYAADLFDGETVERIHRRFECLLRQIAAGPQQPIGAYDLLDDTDHEQLASWNRTTEDYGRPEPVHRLFECQVAAHPDREALVFGAERLSYAELDARANRLAHYLVGQGVDRNSLIGVAAERSVAMVVALYAVQKAGAAYVPVDPEHPQARHQQVLTDAGVDLLLTHDAVIESLPAPAGLSVINLDQLDLADQPASIPDVGIHPEQRAYVIYTSGSTGKPKGVANTHGALFNRLKWMQAAYELGEDDTVLQKTPYSFDVSVWEFFWPLMVGARLVVAQPGDHRDPARLVDQIQRESVTTVHFVPSMLSAFLTQDDLTGCDALRRVICSGEALPKDLQDETLRRLPRATLYNLYGPTEAAIDVTHWTCGQDDRSTRTTVPIGRPIANLQIHVLDDRLNPQPVGVPGELYIGGAGLAQGYHGQPDLTAERFVPSPFANGERLYRSGDLARWCRDGTLEYLGRLDHQIKLRGLRIELGEIEAVLRESAGVMDAVVIASNDQLIGYVQGTGIETDALKASLKNHLPDYMVPAHLMVLERFPLSANGKLDRKALPAPEMDTVGYEAPQTDIEQTLSRLWQEVLGVERVGRQDNFFALGGDSIQSLRIIAKAKRVGLELTPRQMFEHQTIAALARVATHATVQNYVVDMERDFPLTPIQQWFFDQAMPRPEHWNQALLLKPATALNSEALAEALNAIYRHHDALRLRFARKNGEWLQAYGIPDKPADLLWSVTTTPEQLVNECDRAQASLDLSEGPLMRALHAWLDDGSERLLLAVHHLGIDGVSWRILLDDLMQAYQQILRGETIDLGTKATPFQAWADQLPTPWNDAVLAEEIDYWSAIPAPAPLPGVNAGGPNTVDQLARSTMALSAEVTGELLTEAPKAWRTQVNDLLLTALGEALFHWSGRSQSTIALESHGREPLMEGVDLSRTVGWFTSLYPVCVSGGGNIVENLKATKEALRQVPRGGLGYSVLRYLKGEHGLPDLSGAVLFNYLGQVDEGSQDGLVLAEESPGAMRAMDAPLGFELSLDGQVRDGVLSFFCSYSAARYQREAIDELMKHFRRALENVVATCRETGGVTPSDFPLMALDQAVLNALPVGQDNIDDLLPLTPMQQGLLFHSELGGVSDTYVNQVSVTLDDLPVEPFKAAWQSAVARHPVLRAGFIHAPGSQLPVQLIHHKAVLSIRELDWRTDASMTLDALCQQEKSAAFDLARPPLMRMVLIRLGEQRWQMVLTLHHILLDGWSSAALLSEVMLETLGGRLETPARYHDYFNWLVGRDLESAETFWRDQLCQLPEPTRLAPLLADSRCLDRDEASLADIVMHPDYDSLAGFARQQQVTLNTLIQAAWTLILQRYTGQREVAFGATVSGRPAAVSGMDRQIGLFINTLPVVEAPAPEQRLGDWLAELQAHNLALREHEHTPLYQIQQYAGQSGRELFDSLLVFENFPVDDALRSDASGVRASNLQVSEQTHYPLSLAVEAGQGLVLHLHYRNDQVSPARAEALAGQLEHLLYAMARSGEQRLSDLPLLTDREQQVWSEWNTVDHPAVDPRPIPALIAEQARQRPDAVAVVHGDDRLTFAEFDTRANRLAQWLMGQGIGAESRVGVALERGADMLVALYAVHKAGGVYLPLDPDYPAERVRYMLEDSGAALLLTHDAALDRLPSAEGVETVNLDHLDVSSQPESVPEVSIHPEQLAYLIYTSGSTGKPKGVAIPHGGLSMHCQTIGARYGLTPEDRELHFLSSSFDGAHERWLTALSHGARIVLRDQALWSVQETYDCLIHEGITVAAFPPSYLRQLAEWAELKGQPPGVRIYCFAGEAFSRQMMHHAIEHLQPDWVINGYGPTETVVTPTLWRIAADTADFDSAYAPIGDLVGDRQGYVLDADLNLLPPGVAGELYLGGALARGYLDRPDATAERFVPNPFRAGERLYRTGDRVKLNRDGQLEYLGRMDQQVKLRGFRIEIGEVESALKGCEGVKDTLAVVKDTAAGQRLVGYVSGEGLDERAIKTQLREQLPEYMVPSHVVTLAELPKLPNGKLDRNALPEPVVGQSDYEPPATDCEQSLARIWQDLLQQSRVGRQDHFFELGGHSLLATQLVSRLRHEWRVELPLRMVFEAPRLTDMAALLEALEGTPAQETIPALGLEGAPQSFAQQRLWFLDQLEPGATAYNLPGVLDLKGTVDEGALQQALDALAQRHETLRTRLVAAPDGEAIPRQVIDPAIGVPLERVDVSHSDDPEGAFRDHAEAFMRRPFSMGTQPLWRVGLVTMAAKESRLLICLHHAISDGWSVSVLMRDFVSLYRAARGERAAVLEKLPIQYADFSVWQREWLASGEGERQLNYWRAQLGDGQPVLELPTDRPRPARQSFQGARHHFRLGESLSNRLRGSAASRDVTPFMMLLAAYNLLLHRLSGQDDLRVGVPVAGRNRRETEGLVGFFVNTQVLRCELASSQTFEQVLATVRQASIEAQSHQDLPFEQLVEALQPERSLSHNPLFQVAFDYQHRDQRGLGELPGLTAKVMELEDGSTQFDMALNLIEEADGTFSGNWNYATDLFDAATVERFGARFECLLRQIAAGPQQPIGAYDLLDDTDHEQLASWNRTTEDYGRPEPVHRLFECQVAAHPDREALVFGAERLSYAELDARANRLAHYLVGQGVDRNSLIGVAAERSVAMVVALYAVQKAGAAYVPVDPEHPQARHQQVLTDAGVDLLLTHDAVIESLPAPAGLSVINLDQLDLADQPASIPDVGIHPEQRAYVIYTSGSTGKPKGVANTHGALFNRLKWMQAAYELGEDDTVLQKTPYSFDVSVWEFFWPLMVGARLVVAQPGDHRDPARLVDQIQRESVTTVHFVPSMLSAFLTQDDLTGCDALRRVICSGEALPKDLQDETLRRLPRATLYNLYGPTEAAIDVTHWTCGQDDRSTRTTVPIGRPIANLQIHVLDDRLNPQPVGVPGELYIGGAGLAQGYHGQPDLTAERFVPSPFANGERLYRSGDLARWCRDGTLEYLGRLDHQIKLRGLRIELGEIEAVLRESAGVMDAVVIASNDQLIGYVQGTGIETDALKASLKNHLPDYMVPAHLMVLERFPLSANGKLDRKALPAPEMDTVGYEAPQTDIEQTLSRLWQEVLGVERVGRQDNFFALGGHSLLGVTLVHRIRKALHRTLPLSVLFESGSLAGLADVLQSIPADEAPPLRVHDRGQLAPQSFAQQRLWFLAQLEPESSAYHLPGGLDLQGRLNEEALTAAFVGLIQRHESLRTAFRHGEHGRPQQWVMEAMAVPMERYDLRGHDDAETVFGELFREFSRRPFDLETTPPWRVALVQMDTSGWRLLLCMHHIISDGWSMQLLLEELVELYRCASRGEPDRLAPLDVQYADYALWQREQLTGAELDRQLQWWRGQLGDEHPVLELPTDRPRPGQRDGRGARHTFTLPSSLAERLRRTARDQEVSLFMVVLAGFEALLYRLSGQRDLRVGIPVSGRHQPGTEGLIGFFVNTLVVRAEIDPGDRVSDLLAQVRERMHGAQAHADLPFEQLVEALQPERSLSHNPLFQVSYNHQVFDQKPLSDLHELSCEPLSCPAENAHFDLVLGTHEQADGRIDGYLDFATDIFDAASVARMAEQLQALLEVISCEPMAHLSDLPLLTDREQQVWSEWNTVDHPAVDPRPIPALIAEQARQRPDAVAVVHGDDRLTFAEFDTRANRLAQWLMGQGIGAESRVGVALERGADMLVALYAVHKAGGVYLPLDPDYPAERVRYMLEDSGAALLLTHDAALDRLPSAEGVETVNLDHLDVSSQPESVPEVSIHPEQLAYLIYTSGSTGKPKGVAIPHGGLSMHCQTIGARYGLTPEDRELHFLSSSFDGAHERWLTALSHGARIVLRDQALWSVQETYDCLIHEGITVAAFPPSYLRQLAEWAELKGQPPGVRIYCFAGEAFSRQMMHHAIEHLQPDWVINGYGPTETVVTPTLWRIAADTADFDSAYAPIGDLVGDRQGYVLDADLNLLPPGVAGELYLGGALARGYLDRPDATAERFVPNPFRAGERLYRTGDRVKLNRDGQLEYLGRMDQQVKLRGFRIEIGEVESALKGCEGVKDTLAVVKDTAAGQRLVGYVSGEGLDERAIKTQLREQLPEYMVPSHVVTLAELPKLPNGKLDRNALPEPVSRTKQHQRPEGAREVLLAELWAAMLGAAEVGRNDSFFELGGDSIQSLELITRLRQLRWQVTPKTVFLKPRLSELAAALEPITTSASETARAEGLVPLTPIQAHFFEQPLPDYSHWNQSVLLEVIHPLDEELLRRAVAALIEHHDVLRLGFHRERDVWYGNYRATESVDRLFSVVVLPDEGLVTTTCDRIQRSFDLENGPLAAIVLMTLPDGGQRLLVSAHHLIVDGVSWRILLDDLGEAYRQVVEGRATDARLPRATFQSWANHLRDRADQGAWQQELAYWERFATAPEPWPVDNPAGSRATRYEELCEWSLSAGQTRTLLRQTLAAFEAGMDDVMLAALAEGLRAWGGLQRPIVAVEGHGRETDDAALDLSRTLGWFTSLYPVQLEPTGNPLLTLDATRHLRAGIPGKGLGYGALRYLGDPKTRSRLKRLPEPDLAFNYLGQFDDTLASGRFRLAPESAGELVDPDAPLGRELEINGQVYQGQLTLSCRYSGQRYQASTVQRLMRAIGLALETLVAGTSEALPAEAERPSAGKLNPLIRLSESRGTAPQLFCPHPVSGTVVGYYPLASRLAGDWSVWGFQNRQILDSSWRDRSLAAMARDYVKEMLALQPQGPYYLLGWSMGGALVLEMASLLERMGREVAWVGLIDGYIPGAGHRSVENNPESSPEGVAQDEWQQLLDVERHMRRLARAHERVKPLRAPVHVWWAKQSPESNDNAEALLTAFIGCKPASSVWIDTHHLGIVRHPEFLESMPRSLEANSNSTVGADGMKVGRSGEPVG